MHFGVHKIYIPSRCALDFGLIP